MLNRYRVAGKIARNAGWFGYLANGLSTILDINAYNKGKISTMRLRYKMIGTGSSIYVGTKIGAVAGPEGVVAGAAVGAAFDGLEWGYDTFINPAFQEISKFNSNFENAVKSGWVPILN